MKELRISRRGFLAGAGALALPTLARARASSPVTPLDVAYAGSMTSVIEGPIKRAAEAELHVSIQGRAQGASGLAQLIASRAIRPDVFISITASPIEIVRRAGLAGPAVPIARTEMAIAYGARSRFAPRLARTRLVSPEDWWQVLEDPDLRFGRTDPVTDPQGRNIIFVMQLAAAFYRQPDLARRVLGPDINPRQIFTEPSLPARLESGELDAASSYKVQPAAFHLPYITLPEEINLASSRMAAAYQQASLILNGRTYRPEPLVYYAAALKDAAHPREASSFIEWLQAKPAQGVLRTAGYDPPPEAA